MFAFPIAYSDHTPGWDMDLAAVALGANLVEKTISEDRTTRSVEHVMSIEPAEMARFIAVIRDLEPALGSPRRMMTPAEVERRNANRRSIHLRRAMAAGDTLAFEALAFRRPGYRIAPTDTHPLVRTTFPNPTP